MPKVLILRFSSIGDIVLTTPVIRCIKTQVPNAAVHFLTKRSFQAVLKKNPYIDKLFTFENDLPDVIKQLKHEQYDIVIDLHKNIRSFRIKTALRKKSASFNKLNIQKWLLVNFHLDLMPAKHIVDRYLAPAEKLPGIKNDGEGLDYYLDEKDHINPPKLHPALKNPYIAFVIGAQHNTKKLTPEKIALICNLLEYPVVLLGGSDDVLQAEQVMTQTNHPEIVNTCGTLSLNQSASLIQQAGVVITHDTGLMHIAAAFKKRIISIWGNTIPQLGMYPYFPHPDSKIHEVNNLRCRPCSKIGYQKCPKNHFNCITLLNEKNIAEDATMLMQKQNL